MIDGDYLMKFIIFLTLFYFSAMAQSQLNSDVDLGSEFVSGQSIVHSEINDKNNSLKAAVDSANHLLHSSGTKNIIGGIGNSEHVNITSINLSAGKWLISGGAGCSRTGGSSNLLSLQMYWSQTNNSNSGFPAPSPRISSLNRAFAVQHDTNYSESGFSSGLVPLILDLSAGDTVYLNISSSQFSGDWSCGADIIARKIY